MRWTGRRAGGQTRSGEAGRQEGEQVRMRGMQVGTSSNTDGRYCERKAKTTYENNALFLQFNI